VLPVGLVGLLLVVFVLLVVPEVRRARRIVGALAKTSIQEATAPGERLGASEGALFTWACAGWVDEMAGWGGRT